MHLYFFPFFFAFLASGVGIAGILFLHKRFLLFRGKRIERGREGGKNVSRLGGVAAGLAFLATLFLDPSLVLTRDIWGLVAGCFGMLLVGWWDDVRPMGWKGQLAAQAGIVSAILLFFGVSLHDIPNPFGGRIFFEGALLYVGVIVSIGWFLLIINALNWSDGIDGVAPGVVVLSALAFFALSLRPEVYQPPVAILALALLGAYLALFISNMHPAKIFSGTAGVCVAGFAIAYLSLFAGAKLATALVVLTIPIADLLRVVLVRYRSGVPVALPDARHVHYRFLRSGWSERGASFFLLTVAAVAAFSTLVFGTIGKIGILGVLCLCFFLVLRRIVPE